MIVFTTVSKKSNANRIAKSLLDQKLVACVTTLPQAESRYRWKGKVCVEREYVLMIKTTAKAYKKLESALKALHPYDCPEMIGISIDKVYGPYKKWLRENVKG